MASSDIRRKRTGAAGWRAELLAYPGAAQASAWRRERWAYFRRAGTYPCPAHGVGDVFCLIANGGRRPRAHVNADGDRR